MAMPARAKLNLDLQVVRRRTDGMHELRTHMQAVELHDLLVVEPGESTSLSISGFEVAGDATNSVLRAHGAVESAARKELPTRFWLHKRIPPGSGLGGASSDAAAAMRALQRMHGLKLDLREIAAGIGADVTFFLGGGTARVEGIGDQVTPVREWSRWYAIAWPGVELSTAAVYQAWDELELGERHGPNDLRAAAERADASIKRFADDLGEGWQMTGSGSAFFLPCVDQSTAEKAVKRLDCWTAVTYSVGAWTE